MNRIMNLLGTTDGQNTGLGSLLQIMHSRQANIAQESAGLAQALLQRPRAPQSTPMPQYRQGTAEVPGIDLSRFDADTKAFLRKLGKIESGGRYDIGPNRYGYEGMYQFRFREGDDGLKYLRQLGATPEDYRSNPRVQDAVMALALKDYDRQLQSAGLPVNNFTRWLRHNQGLQGTKWLLSGTMTPTLRRNISTNLPRGMAPTIDNYLSYWRKKWM